MAVVRHELVANAPRWFCQVLVEDRRNRGAGMGHHVFAEEPAGIGEPVAVLVVAELNQDARFCDAATRAEHHTPRFFTWRCFLALVYSDTGSRGVPCALVIRRR